VWRFAFSAAGVAGAIGIAMLAQAIWATTDARIAPVLFAVLGVPLYLLVVAVAWQPSLVADAGLTLTPIQIEGLMFSVLAFLGVQEAWVVAMTPSKETAVEVEIQ
jgi:hypothetical protein